ncbi:MAG: MarR family transcriptional regulator [Alphaproteobacteria bacterium]|nr:MarR family transcriptional regulator [Alphaproteobacteria bacterium]
MLDLDDYLPYLLNRAGSRIARAFTRELRAQGITLPIWRVLAALQHRDRQTVSQLAESTAIDISTLSRILDLMEDRGLAVRARGVAGDARSIELRLTPAGRALARRITPVALDYERTALAGLSPAEERQLKRLLGRVHANMAGLTRRRERTALDV